MTLDQITRRVGELGVRSERIQTDVIDFINLARQTIAERKNWGFMHNRIQVSMTPNTQSANLPANWKSLSPERSPVSYNQPGSGFPIVVDVQSREQIEQVGFGWRGWYTLVPNGYLPVGAVFFEQNADGLWTINIPTYFVNTTQITYNVSCYLYPKQLVLGTDNDGMTNDGNLGEAIVNLSKAMLIEAEPEPDKSAQLFRNLAEDYLRKAANDDARRKIVGRVLHM